MTVGYWRKLYYCLDWDYPDKYEPLPETIRHRHLVMKQIRLTTKFKLKKIYSIPSFTLDYSTDEED